MERPDRARGAAGEPGPARLYALLAGALLCLLGVAGFFYDASFETGSRLASDYLAGTLLINGWRNVVYLLAGLPALALATRAPRITACAVGCFFLLLAIWGLIETERGIGSILDTLPLGDRDNVLHLVIGVLGLSAGLLDGPRPNLKVPRPGKRRAATGERGARRRSRAGPRLDADA